MAGNMDWNPSEYVVHNEEQTRRPREGVTSPAPLRHSVMQFHLDSQPGRNKLKPDQSGDPLPNETPIQFFISRYITQHIYYYIIKN